MLYTVGHKKRATLFGIITPMFRGGFLPARRYASAGYRDRNVSVRPSVCPAVCHAPVLCQNEES